MASGYPGPKEDAGLECPFCGSRRLALGVVSGTAVRCLDCGRVIEDDPFAAS